jgi:hypothetical protein
LESEASKEKLYVELESKELFFFSLLKYGIKKVKIRDAHI